MQIEAERIAKGLYKGTIQAGTIDEEMTKLVAIELRKAVIEGFGEDLPNISYGTPDYKMLSSLEINVYHFSAAKNYQMLKSMTLALVDDQGVIRSWNDYKQEALKITGTYNARHLRTEYETAIASAQMAGKWVEAEKNQAAAPWLRYDDAGDGRVRPEHHKLNGVIKRVDDPFWNIYYPPNGFKCRCNVTQLIHGAETPSHSIQLPDNIPDMFKTNMAKDGVVFPNGHPYYIDMPENLKRKAAAMRRNVYSQAYPTEGKTKAGGKVSISNMAHEHDLEYNLRHSTILADRGETINIRPHLESGKNPELELYKGTQIGDFKQPEPKSNPKNSYEHQIKATAQQGGQIPVLVMTVANYNRLDMIRALNNDKLWEKASAITEVWMLFDDQLIKVTREEIKHKKYYSKLP